MFFNTVTKTKNLETFFNELCNLEMLKNSKFFVSGSVLYSNNYNDIDIFLISNESNEEFFEIKIGHKIEKIHLIKFPETKISHPIFRSAMEYSISNFDIGDEKVDDIPIYIEDIIRLYQKSIVNIFNGECKDELMKFIFYTTIGLGKFINSYNLSKKTKELNTINKIDEISNLFVNYIKEKYSRELYLPPIKDYYNLYDEIIWDSDIIISKTYKSIIEDGSQSVN